MSPSAAWLDDGFDDNPTMDVWLDGDKQPIDELRRVEDEQGQTVLVGVGGVELRDRITKDYSIKERDVAASDIITNETSYSADVDTPTWDPLTDAVLQSADTTSEFSDILTVDDTEPVAAQNGNVELQQTAWWIEGEEYVLTSTDTNESNASEGSAENMGSDLQDNIDVSVGHEIPADDVGIGVRVRNVDADNGQEFQVDVEGESMVSFAAGWDAGDTNYAWITSAGRSSSVTGAVTVSVDPKGNGGTTKLDAVVLYDARYVNDGSGNPGFDNSVDGNNHLSTPSPFNTHEFEFDVATTPWNITEATATGTFNDTTGDQRLQVELEGGTWLPDDGTEDNTSSVTVDYSSTPGARIRGRVRLAGFGTASDSPSQDVNGQQVEDWEIKIDADQEPLLIDQRYDSSGVSVLNDIATSEFLWSYNLDSNGNPQVSWTQPAQRTASTDPDLGDVTITKDIATWDKFTVKGANRQISSEQFTASTSFTALNRSDIIPGSETVYDGSGTNFDRLADYEMDYSNGEVKIVGGGALDSGSTYNIDYTIEIEGSFTVSGAPADPVEFVGDAPPVTTSRQAEQIAKTLADDFSGPQWSGQLAIPQSEVTFDVLEALSLTNLDLPASATPIEKEGQPEITPEGITVRLGSDTTLNQALGNISSQVRAVSDRV